MYAITENGIVTDTLRVNPYAIYPDAYASKFIASPDEVQRGWVYDGTTFAAPPAPPIEQQRAALIAQINNDTDALYKSVVGERATEYAQAEEDAQAYKDAGYTGTVPSSVASWAAAKSKTNTWAADDILATALAWRTAQAQIRATRLGAKEAARVATDVGPIAANWAAFLVAAKAQLGVA